MDWDYFVIHVASHLTVVVASSTDSLHVLLLGFTLDLGWPGWPVEYCRGLHCTWGHYGFRFAIVYPLLSSIACFGKNYLPCCENAQAFPWRVLCGKELRPSANSQTNLLAMKVIFLGDWPSSLVKTSYVYSLSYHLTESYEKSWPRSAQPSYTWIPKSQKLVERLTAYYYLKPLNFGIICCKH